MSKREMDLGRLMQRVGRRIEDEGQAASQHFYEWERDAKLPRTLPACPLCDGSGCEGCNGTGNATRAFGGNRQNEAEDRLVGSLRAEWLKVRVQLEALALRADWLMDQAKAQKDRGIDKHRTPAQVEADGWCGNHWSRIGELVPITLRPTGEPWYRGLCRACGAWPDGLPPSEVLQAWRDGRGVKVKAS